MARLIYAVLALALASLVAGFVVRTTAAPLIASVALSAVVTVMILYGWSKRLRTSGAFDDVAEESAPEVEELLVVEVDEAEITGEVPTRRRRRDKVRAAATKTIDRELSFEPARDEDDELDLTMVEPRAKAKPTVKAKPKAKAPASKAKPRAKAPAKSKAPASKAKPKAKAKAAASSGRGPRVVVIPGAAKYHRSGCRFAKGDDLREVSAAVARKRGYEPCGVCKP